MRKGIELNVILNLIILIGLVITSCNGKVAYIKRGILTKGKIENVVSVGSKGNFGTYHIDFSFYIKNQKIKGNYTISSITGALKKALLGRVFPVVYLPEKPESARILMTRYDFESLQMVYPDSLFWIERNR